MMRRIIRLGGLLFGVTLIMMMAVVGGWRDKSPDTAWIIFKTGRATSQHADIYRVLSDGSHLKKISSVQDGVALIVRWERPGWIGIDQRVHGQRRLSWVHLSGHEEVLLEGNFPNLTTDSYRRYYDAQRHRLYLIVPDGATSRLWIIDTRSGQKSVVDMPLTPSNYRGGHRDGGYVFWSDTHSDGDLYRFEFGNPPTITRLTTLGNVFKGIPIINQGEWVYFYGPPTQPKTRTLYRIRPDGSDEQVVAERVLMVENSLSFWSLDADILYYWGGEVDDPTLMRANADGSAATPLPIKPLRAWLVGWSPDHQWAYYRQWATEFPDFLAPSDLHRIHIPTGESQVVLADRAIVEHFWTPDGQWLVLLIQDDHERNWLYRMRPDGTEMTQLGLEVRDDAYFIPQTQQLVFRMWASRAAPGDDVYRLHTLDLDTLAIRPIDDDLPLQTARSILDSLPLPESDWQPLEMVAVGILLVVNFGGGFQLLGVHLNSARRWIN